MSKNLIELIELDNSICQTIYDTSKKNKKGYNITTSTSKATGTWSLACNWEYSHTNNSQLNMLSPA